MVKCQALNHVNETLEVSKLSERRLNVIKLSKARARWSLNHNMHSSELSKLIDNAVQAERARFGVNEESDGNSCFANLDLASINAGRFLKSSPPYIEWLLKDSLPCGKVGLVVADGGTGKGFFLLQLGISIATGIPFLDGLYELGETGKVLLISERMTNRPFITEHMQ